MRLSPIAIACLAATALTACTSSNTIDNVMAVAPSQETTASINRPVPPMAIASLIEQAEGDGVTSEGPVDATVDAYVEAPKHLADPMVAQPVPEKVAMVRPEPPEREPVATRGRQTIYAQKFSDAKPINFGKAHPKHFDVHGVDVSRWQNRIDWVTLRKNGANFAFIKSTDGGDHLDPMFKTNWKAAREAGVPRGAYHFMYWCRSGEAQAKWFIRNVPKEKGALPPVIDAEWNNESKSCRKRPSPKLVRARMKVFMDLVEAHYGQKPIIYTAPDFYEDNLRGHFKEHDFWLRSVAEHPNGRYPEREFLFWQYSGTGKSRGVATHIDLNVFNGSEKAWHRWIAKSVL